jgi:transformation/transcription domain-associated protein
MQTLPTYGQLIEDGMFKFIKLLTETEPQFLTESNVHQLRKKTLEIIQRTNPLLSVSAAQASTSSYDQRYALTREILTLLYQLIEKENEENVIVCLKIILDYHRYLKNTLLTVEVGLFPSLLLFLLRS